MSTSHKSRVCVTYNTSVLPLVSLFWLILLFFFSKKLLEHELLHENFGLVTCSFFQCTSLKKTVADSKKSQLNFCRAILRPLVLPIFPLSLVSTPVISVVLCAPFPRLSSLPVFEIFDTKVKAYGKAS